MWYFAWILGVLLACACAIINVIWLELVAKDVFGDEEDEIPLPAPLDEGVQASVHHPSGGQNQ